MALAKAEGFDITKEEAEAYMDELADVELDEATLAKAAGGDSDQTKPSRRRPWRTAPPAPLPRARPLSCLSRDILSLPA